MISRELSMSSSFQRTVYSEIAEVGWGHLVNLSADLMFISFRILDKKGRPHIIGIQLDKAYPKCPPLVSVDVPYIFNVEWTINSRLKNLVQQFQEHLEKLQEFWSTLDDIDSSVRVVDLKQPSKALSCRQIDIGHDCFMLLSLNAKDPRSLPECRFMGPAPTVNSFIKLWKRNCGRWMKDKTCAENLVLILETQLPRPSDVLNDNVQQVECGICYAHCLPIDDELGHRSGAGTDYTCDNLNCRRTFHSVCLVDWLRSIMTTRQSFNVLFGKCPYCSDPLAIKVIGAKN